MKPKQKTQKTQKTATSQNLAHHTDSRKMAPRSSTQFRIGPPFGATNQVNRIVSVKDQPVTLEIDARIDRGFDQIDGEWIGYKRNYFTLVACFRMVGLSLDTCSKSKFWWVNGDQKEALTSFKMALRHTCRDQESYRTTLVQHTAKRDRGPQSEPPEYPIVPGELPPHEIMRELANIRNGPKISFYDRLFYVTEKEREQQEARGGIISTYPPACRVAHVARYERIQFLTIAVGSRRAATTSSNLSFLEVHLIGITGGGQEVVLATRKTVPLTVRGRSPLNYRQKPAEIGKQSLKAQEEDYEKEVSDEHGKNENAMVPKRKKRRNYAKRKLSPCLACGNGWRGKVLRRNQNLENLANVFGAGGEDVATESSSLLLSTESQTKEDGRLFVPTRLTSGRTSKSCKSNPGLSSEICEAPLVSPFTDTWHEQISGDEFATDSPSKPSKLPLKSRAAHPTKNCKKLLFALILEDCSKRHPLGECLPVDEPHELITMAQDDPFRVDERAHPQSGLNYTLPSQDGTLNVPVDQDSEESAMSVLPTNPAQCCEPVIACPLGCHPSYPTGSFYTFLHTSTPVSCCCIDICHDIHSKVMAIDQHSICKHGFKRRTGHSTTKMLNRPKNRGSSNFAKFRECLEKIKMSIRLSSPNQSLSCLSPVDTEKDCDGSRLDEVLLSTR